MLFELSVDLCILFIRHNRTRMRHANYQLYLLSARPTFDGCILIQLTYY